MSAATAMGSTRSRRTRWRPSARRDPSCGCSASADAIAACATRVGRVVGRVRTSGVGVGRSGVGFGFSGLGFGSDGLGVGRLCHVISLLAENVHAHRANNTPRPLGAQWKPMLACRLPPRRGTSPNTTPPGVVNAMVPSAVARFADPPPPLVARVRAAELRRGQHRPQSEQHGRMPRTTNARGGEPAMSRAPAEREFLEPHRAQWDCARTP